MRAAHGRKGLGGTRPGSLLKNQIPIRTGFWDVSQPGFMEADTVAHCGNSLAGDFVWSLTMTDILTTWTENRATSNKGAQWLLVQIKDVEAVLPFALLGFDWICPSPTAIELSSAKLGSLPFIMSTRSTLAS